MKALKYLVDDHKVRLFYQVLAIASGATIMATTLYGVVESVRGYITNGIVTVGETLVEIEWPLPFFAKPVTYLSFSLVVFYYSLAKLYEPKIRRLSNFRRSLYSFVALLILFGAGYEVLYNFTVWGALMSAEAFKGIVNPDFLNIAYPDPTIPWNLVFATKMFLAVFVIAFHSFFLFRPKESLKTESIPALQE